MRDFIDVYYHVWPDSLTQQVLIYYCTNYLLAKVMGFRKNVIRILIQMFLLEVLFSLVHKKDIQSLEESGPLGRFLIVIKCLTIMKN